MEQIKSEVKNRQDEKIAAIIGVVLLIIVVTVGGIWYAHNRTNNKASGQTTQTGQQKARGYTLTPPDGWHQVSPTPEGVSVAFAAPKADSDDGGMLTSYIAVQSTNLNQSAKTVAFKDLAQSYIAQMASGYTNFQSLSVTDKTIAGLPAILETFTFSDGKAAVTGQSLFMVKDGISYAANGEALSSVWPQYAADIEQSLLTLRP